jgi:hypothetical protein
LIKDFLFLLKDQSLNYIVLDYPFAYLNNEMRDYIDLSIVKFRKKLHHKYEEIPLTFTINRLV